MNKIKINFHLNLINPTIIQYNFVLINIQKRQK